MLSLNWKPILAAILAFLLFGQLVGCIGDNGKIDAVRTTESLRDAGFKGKAVFIFGNAHFLGQSFNLTGSSGYAEVIIDPSQAAIVAEPVK